MFKVQKLPRITESTLLGCVTNMMKDFSHNPQYQRKKEQCLKFLFKVIKGLVPAIQTDFYISAKF